jgi:HTH-type transcriptional regulator/antitoxin HigA
MEIRPIKNEEEYQTSLRYLKDVWHAEPNTKEGDQLELLLLVIEKYEAEQFPIPKLNPIEAIKYKMEENNLSQKDLVRYLGTKSRVSEVLNGKKPLTLRMIKNLHKEFGISAETLLA